MHAFLKYLPFLFDFSTFQENELTKRKVVLAWNPQMLKQQIRFNIWSRIWTHSWVFVYIGIHSFNEYFLFLRKLVANAVAIKKVCKKNKSISRWWRDFSISLFQQCNYGLFGVVSKWIDTYLIDTYCCNNKKSDRINKTEFKEISERSVAQAACLVWNGGR